MAVFPTGVRKSMIFTILYCLRSPGGNCCLRLQKYYRWTSQQWNCRLMFFLFEDFDLTTKQSLAIDVCICLNHQERRSLLASLSARSRRWSAILRLLSPGQTESQVDASWGLAHTIRWRVWSLYNFLASFSFLTKFTLRDLDKVLHGNV